MLKFILIIKLITLITLIISTSAAQDWATESIQKESPNSDTCWLPPQIPPRFYYNRTFIFIVDSGTNNTLPILKDQVLNGWVYNTDNDSSTIDTDGHGTTMATITAIVSPTSWIVPVKVYSDTLNPCQMLRYGLTWISDNLQLLVDQGINAKYVINISLNTCRDSLIPFILKKLHNNGAIIVSATANNNKNQCNEGIYPADYEQVISVGAINQKYNIAKFSNYGPCIDLYAPGYFNQYQGTSIASSLVSGTIANYLYYNKTIDQFFNDTIKNSIKNLPNTSKNILLFGGKFDDYEMCSNGISITPLLFLLILVFIH